MQAVYRAAAAVVIDNSSRDFCVSADAVYFRQAWMFELIWGKRVWTLARMFCWQKSNVKVCGSVASGLITPVQEHFDSSPLSHSVLSPNRLLRLRFWVH